MIVPGPRASPEATVVAGVLLSFVGGFLDAFTFIGHGGVFANAQTGNVVLAAVALVDGDWAQAGWHTPPIIAFLIGIFVVRLIQHFAPRRRWSPAFIALVIETAILLTMIPLPAATLDFWIVIAVSFAAALQFAAFTSVGGWAYTSIATTGNLRRLAEAVFAAITKKNDPERAQRLRAFWFICLAFFAGAVVGAFATRHLHNLAVAIPGGCLLGILIAVGLSGTERPSRA